MTKQNYVILGIILIIILVFAGAVFVREKGEESAVTPPPVSQPPVITPTPVTSPIIPTTPTPQTVQIPEGWKTYENKEFGFAFDYPGDVEIGGTVYETDYGRQRIISVGYPGDFDIFVNVGLNSDETIKNIIPANTKMEEAEVAGIIARKFLPNNSYTIFIIDHPYLQNTTIGIPVPKIFLDTDRFISSFRFLP